MAGSRETIQHTFSANQNRLTTPQSIGYARSYPLREVIIIYIGWEGESRQLIASQIRIASLFLCRKCVLNCLTGASHNKVNIQSRRQRGWVAEWLRHPTNNLETRVQFPTEPHFHSCNQLSRFLSSIYYYIYICIYIYI